MSHFLDLWKWVCGGEGQSVAAGSSQQLLDLQVTTEPLISSLQRDSFLSHKNGEAEEK